MKKNGFTLIELLAIIVIIAVIALITVPKINDVIETSQQGIARDSAYGYKKAVDDYYYHHTMNKENVSLNGAYKVNNLGELYDNVDVYDIDFDGSAPIDGLLIYDDAELVSGCLTINKYKIEFTDGEVSLVEQGTCNVNELQIALSCDSSYNASSESWFDIDSSTGELQGFSDLYDDTKDIIIPCTVNGTYVKSIKNSAFKEQELTSVVLPSTLSKIGSESFLGNYLTNIEIPNSVTEIGSNAFKNNQLQTVNIPNSVKAIENSTFENNQIFKLSLPKSVSSIKARAFANNNIESVTFTNNLKTIEGWAFYNNNLTSINIPSSVTNIGAAAFNKNQLDEQYSFIYDRNEDGTINNKILVSYGGKNKNITLPNTIETLMSYSLYNDGLEEIVLSDNLKTIKNSALSNNSLTSIDIKSSVTNIEDFALANNLITEISIPNTVKSLGVAILNNNLLDGDDGFIYARNNGIVDNTTLISYGGEEKDVTLPDNVITIGKQAFYSTNIESILLNNNLTTIKSEAFSHNNLTEIIIPSNVTTIEGFALSDNGLLTSIVNQTGSAFNWEYIIGSGSSSSTPFETGEVGTVEITN